MTFVERLPFLYLVDVAVLGVGKCLQIQARQGLEGRRSRCGTKWSNGAGRDPRNPGKPTKMASLPFLSPGFLAKKRELLRKHLTRPPWRCLLDR